MITTKPRYKVWRLGLAYKYYEGAKGGEDRDDEVLAMCIKEGIFPFHVHAGFVPSNYGSIDEFARLGEDDASTEKLERKKWRPSLWRAYNLIRPGDRVILTKVKKPSGGKPVAVLYAKGTVTDRPRYVPGCDPYGYRMTVSWDLTSKAPEQIAGLNADAGSFYSEITGDSEQLTACDEFKQLFDGAPPRYKSLNLILCGPPGTGKTWSVRGRACQIVMGNDAPKKEDEIAALYEELISTDEPRVEFVTFHPSYDYSDFIEGYRPNAQGSFDLKPGILKRMARRATLNPRSNYVLVIDEINRGNVAKIFGETITLLEDDKRAGGGFPIALRLPSSPSESFSLPQNLYVLGTMNTADRSIAMLDIALRRRFDFEEILPNPELLKNKDVEFPGLGVLSQKKFLTALNKVLEDKLESRDQQVGHAWLVMDDNPTPEKVLAKFEAKILPLLLEWFYERDQRKVLFDEVFGKKLQEDDLASEKIKRDKKFAEAMLYVQQG